MVVGPWRTVPVGVEGINVVLWVGGRGCSAMLVLRQFCRCLSIGPVLALLWGLGGVQIAGWGPGSTSSPVVFGKKD